MLSRMVVWRGAIGILDVFLEVGGDVFLDSERSTPRNEISRDTGRVINRPAVTVKVSESSFSPCTVRKI